MRNSAKPSWTAGPASSDQLMPDGAGRGGAVSTVDVASTTSSVCGTWMSNASTVVPQ